jgi:hypothetical protein
MCFYLATQSSGQTRLEAAEQRDGGYQNEWQVCERLAAAVTAIASSRNFWVCLPSRYTGSVLMIDVGTVNSEKRRTC